MKYTGGHLNEEQLLDYRYGDLAEANANDSTASTRMRKLPRVAMNLC